MVSIPQITNNAVNGCVTNHNKFFKKIPRFRYPDQPHNLINCSLYHCQAILKISPKSVNNLSNVDCWSQTDKPMPAKT